MTSTSPFADHTSDGGRIAPPADRFPKWPLIAAVAVWGAAIVPLVYDIGGLFVDPSMLPALLILPLALLAWVIVLAVTLVRRRWRNALSVIGALVVFLMLSFPTLIFAHEIHFITAWPVYAIEVTHAPTQNGMPTKLSWQWSAGFGYQETLFYDASDQYTPPQGESEYVDNKCTIGDSCSVHIRRMGGHFYLSTLRY